MIKKFTDLAALKAAKVAAGEPTVGLLDNKDTAAIGVNTIVTVPQDGDIIMKDTVLGTTFIVDLDSYDATLKPASWSPIGVVGDHDTDNALVIYKSNAGKKQAETFRWKVSGSAMTDGVQHTGALSIGGTGGITENFTWETSTIEDFAAALNTFLQTNHPDDQPYSCYVDTEDNNLVIIQQNNYNGYRAVSLAGVTVDAYTMAEVAASYNLRSYNGLSGDYRGSNLGRLMTRWEGDESDGTWNPTSVISSVPQYPVCLPAYLGTSQHRDGDKCAWLRAKYGEGVEGWKNYLADTMACEDQGWGPMQADRRDGKAETYKLVGKTFLNANNERQAQYPAAEYVAAIDEGVDYFRAGDWFEGSAFQMGKISRKLEYGNKNMTRSSDRINRGLEAIGGSAISTAAYWWCVSPSHAYLCWFLRSGGVFYTNSFCGTYGVVPLALYPLKK